MQVDDLISICPSFNSYSNCGIAAAASRTAGEFNSDEFSDEFRFENPASQLHMTESDADDEFEFAFVTRESGSSSPITDHEKIRPVYPVFNRDLLAGEVKSQNENGNRNCNSVSSEDPKIRISLRKLFTEERETAITRSPPEEDDELDEAAAETYCMWRPKVAVAAAEEEEPYRNSCNSKRWKLKTLLHRVAAVEDRPKNSLTKLF
ncbi:hypothetical protein ACP275_04G173400 [Erythranthe tilingii]